MTPNANNISLLGIKLYRKVKCDQAHTQKHYILGKLIRYKENERHCWDLTILGIKVLYYNKKCLKFFYIPIWKFNWRKKWLDKLQSQIDPKYDDIYLLRHNIGETTVELMLLKERIKANKSQKPLLIVWNKKNIGYYKMFVKDIVDMQYIKLHQFDVMSVFSEKMGDYKEVILKQNNQRFICSTPQVADYMLEYNINNFYAYIRDCCRIPENAIPNLPVISEQTKANVIQIMQKLGLHNKFVIIAPEANSLVKLPSEFWQDIMMQLKKQGYDIFMNAYHSACGVDYVKTDRLSLEELFGLAQKSERIITLGSGLAVLLALAQVPMDIIYTEFADKKIGYTATQTIEKYSVFHLPMVKKENITEYNIDTATLDDIKKAILQKL